ncbi:ATP-dependent DNA helicase RecG [Pseudoclavibacter chungangensis]|uniref:Probable DNA 3'-5' helicase RecG n=1 Tax=Pseudoclavibacter chungangensis TaxID=587635 RepID=A0A7J5C1Q4_9MICO|nr:ATP-dependent DNA helicase RecG [Pseudoclavibacter chungangensis]KAB1659721.1 ATP-dependent DNA helicase RecG [Pseudoclavibacter chungangensis]
MDDGLEALVGSRVSKPLAKDFGMRTVADLLHHFPRRYQKRGELTAIDELPIGEHVTLVADVRDVRERKMRNRRGSILEVVISDGRGIVTLTFFNQAWRATELRPGKRGTFAGKTSMYRGVVQLAHPEYQLDDPTAQAFDEIIERGFADPDDPTAATPSTGSDERRRAQAREWAERPMPIYPASAKFTSWKIAALVATALDAVDGPDDPVPAEVRRERGLMGYAEALRLLHSPETFADVHRARDALRFTEAFVLQAALLQQRAAMRATPSTAREAIPGGLLDRLDARLPFERTGDQVLVGDDIARDIAGEVPMHRLVQGEVGSGKTLVAVRAMLQVAESGGQSALLAPTEVLAAQHHRSIVEMLGPELSAELMPTLVTGGMSTSDRRRALLRIVTGDARLVIGTHALLSDWVDFFDLGLVVVDEQHRFGVEQREQLRAKGRTPPHLLVLTATPIPRTVAMTVFGDLDISTIAQLPSGRAGIESFVVGTSEHPRWLERAWERVAEELSRGRQAFIVCPAVVAGELEDGVAASADEAEAADNERGIAAEGFESGGDATRTEKPFGPGPASVEQVAAFLRASPLFRGRTVAELHGRLPSDEKDAVMRAFAAGRTDLLVATTVIEVGVNVPNASVMLVLDAERFGVSQLHQLRGRVGRGEHAGLCLLVTSSEPGTPARGRVDAVASTLDGFELAQRDLELRHEGDVLGTAQSGGRSSLKLLRVVQDADVIDDARAVAGPLVDADPALRSVPALAAAIRRLHDAQREFLGKS